MSTVLDNFDPTKHFFKDPYPHVIIENALPQDLYDKLANEFPVEQIKEHQPILEGHTHRYFAYDVLHLKKFPVSESWENFFREHTSQAYYDKIVDLFKVRTDKTNVKVEVRSVNKKAGGLVTDTQFVVHKPYEAGTTRTTHIDNPQELYAGLLYFRQDGDESQGGDFEIFSVDTSPDVLKLKGREVKKDQQKKLAKTIKYKANTFVMFLNTDKSVHGVTPRTNAKMDRLSINIIAETNSKQDKIFRLHEHV